MRSIPTLKLLSITALALTTAACAEFSEEADEAVQTLADDNATWEQAGDEAQEAVESLAPGEQKEGDLKVRIDALDGLLQDLESAVQDLDGEPDPNLNAELEDLKQTAVDARDELEQVGDQTSDAAEELTAEIDAALETAEARLAEINAQLE